MQISGLVFFAVMLCAIADSVGEALFYIVIGFVVLHAVNLNSGQTKKG